MDGRTITSLLVLLFCFVTPSQGRGFSLDLLPDITQSEEIDLKFAGGLWRKARSVSGTETQLVHTSFKSSAGDVTLRMTKKSHGIPNVPLFQGDGETITPVILDDREFQCTSVYKDSDFFATVFVDHCGDEDTVPSTLAELFINGTRYMILPVYDGDSKMGARHRLIQMRERGYECPIGSESRRFEETTPTLETPLGREKRQVSPVHTVELLFALDHSLYAFWYSMTSGTEAVRAALTDRQISWFYNIMAEAVSERYQNIDALNITVKLVGIYKATTTAASPWTDTIQNNGVVDATAALGLFQTWTTANAGSLQSHDHAQALTLYDLSIDGNTGAAGLATVGGICTEAKQSIIEASFDYLSYTTSAHEIGHSLGGVHDGDNGNGCLPTDGYILAPSNKVQLGSKSYNPWLFSPCSVAAFGALISSRNQPSSQYPNCMLTQTATNFAPFIAPPPGEEYTVDQQCSLAQGTTSYMCRHLHGGLFSGICRGMWCSTSDVIEVCHKVIPGEGTPCASGKVCSNGDCVVTEGAQVFTDDSCMFGDLSGTFSDGEACATEVVTNKASCYDNVFRLACCRSCDGVKSTVTGCEFGDHRDCSSVVARNCYTQATVDDCCQTCAALVDPKLPQDCQYGDRVANCQLSLCGTDNGDCCGTCHDVTTTTTTPSTTTTTPATTTTTPTTLSTTAGSTTATSAATTASDPFSDTLDTSDLPSWVIPVAVTCGLVVLALLLGTCMCCFRSRYRDGYRNRHRHRNWTYQDDGKWYALNVFNDMGEKGKPYKTNFRRWPGSIRDDSLLTPYRRSYSDNFFNSRKDPDRLAISRRDPDNLIVSRRDQDNLALSRRDPDNLALSQQYPDKLAVSRRDPDILALDRPYPGDWSDNRRYPYNWVSANTWSEGRRDYGYDYGYPMDKTRIGTITGRETAYPYLYSPPVERPLARRWFDFFW